jgi:hypothetical protein
MKGRHYFKMEKRGMVSIWLGLFNPIERLQEYLQVNYTSDVDFIDSQFEKDFNIEYFDEDLREIDYLQNPTNSISDILKNHSYCESIISNYTQKLSDELDREYNSLILLYDYNYTGSQKEIKFKKSFIKFIGSVNFNR